MTNFEYKRLHHNLKLLKLGTFESVLDNYLEIAAKLLTQNKIDNFIF